MSAKMRARRHSISSPLELEVSKPLAGQIDAQVIISRKRPADNTISDLDHVEKRPALADIFTVNEKLEGNEELPSGECSMNSYCHDAQSVGESHSPCSMFH